MKAICEVAPSRGGKSILVLTCSLLILLVSACSNSNQNSNGQQGISSGDSSMVPDVENEPIATSVDYCGLSLDPAVCEFDTVRVKPNQFFNQLLQPYGVSGTVIQQLVDSSKDVFDLRKIQSGKNVTYITRTGDSTDVLDYMVYHHSIKEKVIYRLKDSADVWKYELPVDTVRRALSNRIPKTLYHSILALNTSYELGIRLSEVFAWQVDFFKIDVNDHFKVVYDEYRINEEVYAIGDIYCAEFYHRGDTFRAYKYAQDDVHTYFDDEGKSLRKAFLKAPLKYSRISSRYSGRRFHPVQKRWKAHLGTDYAAPTGTPIRSVGDGVVIASSYTRGNGNYVKVKHNATYTTQYLHMSKRLVRQGQRVTQGQVIGKVGSTGLATGPHLCFRFWMHGRQVDPFKVKIPPSIPIKEENLEHYMEVKDSLKVYLTDLILPDPPQEES